jgi:hypothetical protein
MSCFHAVPHLHETPLEYGPSPQKDIVYEVSLRTKDSSDWLKDLQNAHRLVQAMVQGQLLEEYDLLDFVIWPEGVFTRVSLKGIPSLANFLRLLKEKSVPAGTSTSRFWDDDLQWIKLVPADDLSESTRLFLERAERVRREVSRSFGFSPNLFFFYRNPRLSR